MLRFEGFADSDFDAFAPSKWQSHAFNRERLEVKLKLSDLGVELEKRLAMRLAGQEMGLTPERPSIFNQHQVRDISLYFLRNEQSRRILGSILDQSTRIADTVQDPALHHQHIMLAFRMHQQGVEIGLWLHESAWADWKNMLHRCREYWEKEKLDGILAALPTSIAYARGRPEAFDIVSAANVGVERILESFLQTGPWSFFGEVLDRTQSVLVSPDLTGHIDAVFSSLIELYQYISWRPDNDYHNLNAVVKKEKHKVETKFTELKPGDKVKIVKGLATGRTGIVSTLERKGKVKIRLGTMLVTMQLDEVVASK